MSDKVSQVLRDLHSGGGYKQKETCNAMSQCYQSARYYGKRKQRHPNPNQFFQRRQLKKKKKGKEKVGVSWLRKKYGKAQICMSEQMKTMREMNLEREVRI